MHRNVAWDLFSSLRPWMAPARHALPLAAPCQPAVAHKQLSLLFAAVWFTLTASKD